MCSHSNKKNFSLEIGKLKWRCAGGVSVSVAGFWFLVWCSPCQAPLSPLLGHCVFIAVIECSCHVDGWHVGSTSQSTSRLGTWKMSNLWPSGASKEMVTEEECLLWHRPAADVVFQLLQQTGGNLYKSKTPLIPALFSASFWSRDISSCQACWKVWTGSLAVVWLLAEDFTVCFLGIIIVRLWWIQTVSMIAAGLVLATAFQQSSHPVCESVLGMNNTLWAGGKHGWWACL